MLSFFESLNLSPFNYKYLEKSKSISCRVGRKNLGKVHVTLQKMAKLYKSKYAKNVAKKSESQCRLSAYCPAFK